MVGGAREQSRKSCSGSGLLSLVLLVEGSVEVPVPILSLRGFHCKTGIITFLSGNTGTVTGPQSLGAPMSQ